jgi:hypothetical protein
LFKIKTGITLEEEEEMKKEQFFIIRKKEVSKSINEKSGYDTLSKITDLSDLLNDMMLKFKHEQNTSRNILENSPNNSSGILRIIKNELDEKKEENKKLKNKYEHMLQTLTKSIDNFQSAVFENIDEIVEFRLKNKS